MYTTYPLSVHSLTIKAAIIGCCNAAAEHGYGLRLPTKLPPENEDNCSGNIEGEFKGTRHSRSSCPFALWFCSSGTGYLVDVSRLIHNCPSSKSDNGHYSYARITDVDMENFIRKSELVSRLRAIKAAF